MNDEDDQQAEAPQESIWQPLDGSAPARPEPAAAPFTFTKPEPRPLAFPSAPAPGETQDPFGRPAETGGRPVFVLANWGARFGAYIIDNIVFGIVVLFATMPAAIALGMTVEEAFNFLGGSFKLPDTVTTPALAWALFGLQILGPPFLAAGFLALRAGQTPGKSAVGIRVVPEDGTPMTFGRAVQREVVAKTLILVPLAALTLLVAFLANYLWPLRDAQNRAGHDFFAKTRVVKR